MADSIEAEIRSHAWTLLNNAQVLAYSVPTTLEVAWHLLDGLDEPGTEAHRQWLAIAKLRTEANEVAKRLHAVLGGVSHHR